VTKSNENSPRARSAGLAALLCEPVTLAAVPCATVGPDVGEAIARVPAQTDVVIHPYDAPLTPPREVETCELAVAPARFFVVGHGGLASCGEVR